MKKINEDDSSGAIGNVLYLRGEAAYLLLLLITPKINRTVIINPLIKQKKENGKRKSRY